MKIGVALRLGDDAGELFADARALESAGVDALWALDNADDDNTLLLAAVAAVTWRARLVCVRAPEDVSPRTLERLSRSRFVIADERGDAFTLATAEGERERWMRADFPKDRAAWKAVRAEREAEGVAGLVLQNDPRLLDLLRNPDTEDDRSDIKLAFG